MRSRSLTPLLAVPLLTLAACGGGGGSSDSDQITAIVKDGAKDPVTICDHLDAAVLKQFGGAASCKKAAQAARKTTTAVTVKSVTVKGDTATAQIQNASGPQTLSFSKQDGKWVLSPAAK